MNQSLKLLYVPLLAAFLSAGVQVQTLSAKSEAPATLSKSSENVTRPLETQSSITVVGVLGPVPLESFDCYGIKTLDGQTFQLVGEFPKQDGALVQVRGKLLDNVRTACRVQGVLQVESVKILRQKFDQQIPKSELPPSLPEGVVFQAISSGGIAGLTTETTVLQDGRVIAVTRGGSIISQSELCRISPQQLRQFQQLVESQQFARLNGLSVPPEPRGADIISTTFTSRVGTVSFDSIARSEGLPKILQKVDQALGQLCN